MTTFKVLTHGRIDELNKNFVDEALLRKGIYNISIPKLHANTLTIAKLKEDWKYILRKINENPKTIDTILSNLSKCQLTEVDLILV